MKKLKYKFNSKNPEVHIVVDKYIHSYDLKNDINLNDTSDWKLLLKDITSSNLKKVNNSFNKNEYNFKMNCENLLKISNINFTYSDYTYFHLFKYAVHYNDSEVILNKYFIMPDYENEIKILKEYYNRFEKENSKEMNLEELVLYYMNKIFSSSEKIELINYLKPTHKYIEQRKKEETKKCYVCKKNITSYWLYMPGNSKKDDIYCNDCVPRGCSCNQEEFKSIENIKDNLEYYKKNRNIFDLTYLLLNEKREIVNDVTEAKSYELVNKEEKMLSPCCEYNWIEWEDEKRYKKNKEEK